MAHGVAAMSRKAVDWVLSVRFSPKHAATRLVLVVLAHHYNDLKGRAYPSVKRLAEECSLSRRQVHYHLRLLEASRLLCIEHERRADGTQRASSYTFPPFEAQRAAEQEAREAAASDG